MASRARVFLFAGIAGPPGKRKNDSSGRRGSRAHPVLEMLKRLRELYGRVRSPHQLPANLRRLIQQLAIPAKMFARDPHPTLLAVKGVQGVKMRQDDITQLGALKWRRRISLIQMGVQMGVDSAEDPWRTMTRAADHYSVGTREIKHLARFLRRGDVAVREHRNAQLRLDGADRLVLGGPCVEIRACAPVDRERSDATTFRDARDLDAARVPQPHVRGDHLGRRQARAEGAAQQSERAIGYPGHRREHHGGGQDVRSDPQARLLRDQRAAASLAQVTAPSRIGRQASISKPTALAPGSTKPISASMRSPADKKAGALRER